MSKILRRLWNDPVWSKVIATAIVAVLAMVATYFLNWWPVLGRMFSEGWSRVVQKTPTPNWLLAILVLLAVPALLVIGAISWRWAFPPRPPPASWADYTTDSFLGLRWRWRYLDGGLPHEFHTFCPICDYQVVAERAGAYQAVPRIAFHCDVCGRDVAVFGEPLEVLESKVGRLIQQKIRNEMARETPRVA